MDWWRGVLIGQVWNVHLELQTESTLSKPQDVRRGMVPKRKVLSKKSTVGWANSQTLWRDQKSSLGTAGVGFPLPGLLERFSGPYQPVLVLSQQKNSLSPERWSDLPTANKAEPGLMLRPVLCSWIQKCVQNQKEVWQAWLSGRALTYEPGGHHSVPGVANKCPREQSIYWELMCPSVESSALGPIRQSLQLWKGNTPSPICKWGNWGNEVM